MLIFPQPVPFDRVFPEPGSRADGRMDGQARAPSADASNINELQAMFDGESVRLG